MKKVVCLLLSVVAAVALFPLCSWCAEPVYLYLKANGVDIKGESRQTSLGRADSIECTFYEQGATRTVLAGVPTSRLQYSPIVIRKRIDKASPLLLKAVANNERVDGTFKFFRRSPTGDGTTEQFYTVMINNGFIVSLKQIVPDTMAKDSIADAPMEELSFVFDKISWTITKGGVTFEDSHSGGSPRP